MKMTRTVYHFAGKDYETNQTVNFNFILPRNSIQSFLVLCAEKGIRIKPITKTFTDGSKLIETYSFPENLASLCNHLGKRDWHEVLNGWQLTHSILRVEKPSKKYFGYMCYNPQTKTTELKSNSPFVIKGKQQVFNGKLWRRV